MTHHAHQEPGTIVKIFKDAIGVKVQDGVYIITEFQLEGKKRMLVKDYLNGHNIFEVDQKFGIAAEALFFICDNFSITCLKINFIF